MRRHDLTLASTPLTGESVSESDAVVIVTDHDGVDYRMITDNARLILDTRSALRKRQIACPPGVLVSA
jgi:UDP-N-acetyl-D-glucosamine dehydrogenase